MNLQSSSRKLSTEERKALEDSLRSSNASVLHRCQILVTNARGEIAQRTADNLGCRQQTMRNTIHEFNEKSLKSLTPGSSRPREVRAALDEEPEGPLTAHELTDSICKVFGCAYEEHLSIPREVA